MRFAIYLLVAANLALFAYAGGFVGPHPANDEGAGELSPGRIRLVARGEAPPAPAVPPAPAPAGAASPAPAACAQWAELGAGLADRVAQASEASGIVLERVVAVPDSSRWWVNIAPPSGGRAAAEKKATELRKLGVRRFSIVEVEGEHLNAISFGRFDAEAEAQKLIDGLRQKGVRSARITVESAGDGRVRLTARGPADSIAALRAEFAQWPAAACAPGDAPAGAPAQGAAPRP